MTHSTLHLSPPAIPHAGYRAALLHFCACVLLALIAMASNASAQTPPKVSMMPSYNQNPTYANAAINEPIQVWGRVSGGSGTYPTYTLDFGDGTSEAVTAGPQAGPATIDSITFEMLDTCSLGTYTFYLNGVLLGSTASNPSNSCTCTPPLTSFTINNAALLAANWTPNSAVNALRIDVAGGQYVAWARATIVAAGSTQTAYIINGGNGVSGNGLDLCSAGYRSLGGSSFSNNNLYAPAAGAFAVQDGPDFVKKDHTYTTGGSKTVTLTVTDSAGNTASRSSVIRVLQSPTHDERVNMAIEKGLIYLYRTQVRQGAPLRSYWTSDDNQNGNAATGAALMSFAENGHLASNDPVADVYAETVQRGIYQIVSLGRNQALSPQADGDPNANGHGRGINFSPNYVVYDSSIMLMGVINAFPDAATATATAIPAGLWVGGGTAPANFHDFVADGLQCFYWCQADSGLKGWWYQTNMSSQGGVDGSTHQWPGVAILTAKERWGLVSPAWVVQNSTDAFVGLQHLATGDSVDGGVGYGSNGSWRNSAKTGGALMGFYLGGKLISDGDDNAIRARDFLARHWYSTQATGSGGDSAGWDGELYAMFGMKKGLLLQGVTNLTTPDGVVHDWYQDMSAWLLGNASLLNANVGPGGRRDISRAFGQNPNGSWNTSEWPVGQVGSIPLVTAHAILVLTKSVTIPLPVAVIAPIPDQSSRHPAAFTVDGSASYHQSTNSTIVEFLWDLDASNGLDWDHPDAAGRITSANPGWSAPGDHTVTLRVKDDAATPNYATATTVVKVVDTDVAPVAMPIPTAQLPAVYTGKIGDTIVLNGIESYDPDGDPITGYAWDLDGNGTFGDAADAAKDSSGNAAHGVTASLIFTAEYNGQIGLRVTSTPPDGIAKSSNNMTTIDVQATTSDLYVASMAASNVVIGTSADIQVVVVSAATSGNDATSVVVRFYDGNPLTTGNVIGSSATLSIPKGTSQVVNATGLRLAAGQETVWVYVDATKIFTEFHEGNNTASVNVSNHPPVAVTKNASVSAGANCSADASIDDGSSDPDAHDPITITQEPAGPYGIGATPVTLTVTDSHGVSSSSTATVTVTDNAPPVISGFPNNIVVQTGPDSTECGQVASWSAPRATDCSAVTLQASHAPDSSFPVGTTTVVYMATDSANNVATCSFTVTVEDTTAPVIPVLADVTGECSATIATAPTTTDNCAGVITGTTGDATTRTEQGTSLVTWAFDDGHGNVVTATQHLVVKDVHAPVITGCPTNLVVNTGLAWTSCDQVATWTAPVASDNCSVSMVSNHNSGDTFPVGTTTVTYTATDGAVPPNTTACSFTVTVVDSTAPTITTTAMVIVSDRAACTADDDGHADWDDDGHGDHDGRHRDAKEDHGSCKNNHNDGDNGGHGYICKFWNRCRATGVVLTPPVTSDNCGVASVSNNHPSTTYPLGVTLVTWTVTDIHGNASTAEQKVTVVASVEVEFEAPVARKPVGNTIKKGQVVPLKVDLASCLGNVVKTGATVRLRVQGIAVVNGVETVFQEVVESATGVGIIGSLSSDGLMVPNGGHWQYNLDTSNFSDANTVTGDHFYRATVMVFDNATLALVGVNSISMETGSKK